MIDVMVLLTFIFVGLFGLIIGSFLNVLIYRLPNHNFFGSIRSYCPHCKTKLKWFELIPVFSYIFLGGKCRTCKKPISPRYPLVEISNTIFYVLCYYFYGVQWVTPIFMILCSTLIVITFIDIDTMEIPDGLNLTVAILGLFTLIIDIFTDRGILWWENLAGSILIGGSLFVIMKFTDGIGGGDVKLAFGIGLIFGWKLGLLAILSSFIIGGIIACIILFVDKKTTGKTEIAFGPYIALGTLITIFFGNGIINWYLNLLL